MEPKNQNHKPKEEADKPLEEAVSISQAEYQQLKEDASKSKELWDKLARLQADFDNARKRWDKQRQEYVSFANENLLCDLLTIIDELERSLELSQQKHEDFTAFLKGVEMILAHLYDLLKRNGVQAMCAKGKSFDPNFHEALMQVEKEDTQDNTIVEEMQKGYTLNGRVLRTAKVQVSKKKQ